MASPSVRASTTHAALSKIIAIISTVSPPPSQPTVVTDPDEQRSNCKRGLGIDLNLRLGPWPDRGIGSVVDGGGGATTCSWIVDGSEVQVESGVVSSSEKKPLSAEGSISGEALTADKSSQGECDPEDRGGTRKTQGGGREYYSEITNIPEETETEGLRRKNEGYLDLLLEAVRQVSGGLFSEGADEKESETKAVAAESSKRSGLDLYEETGPVVRSKRGRSQALPSRYRDSVLEPWGKLPTVTRCSRAARR
ncbi:hypothetical protein J5N97_012252 [Dioscorea zingiberensis]|uniref:Uncharacterized protein n=1 Tax=Dioscorea zingiberensis TaxID=325984 RepID=A0A9D5CR78_9LILI|nr:hypothetical protein J5N97_012252 [Dioscorea zingiberensis]